MTDGYIHPEDEVKPSSVPVKWGDSQQYYQNRGFTLDSSPGTDDGSQGVVPKVTLLSMTAEPLRAIAAMAAMYEGGVVRDLSELSEGYVRAKWEDVIKTHLDTPLEAVQLHFLIEGVDRAFTHQLVRQRVGAAYAQESLRFAVVDDLNAATTLPPSLAGTKHVAYMSSEEWAEHLAWGLAQDQEWRLIWDDAIDAIDKAYAQLVHSGMPAEEARGLLPHCTATRIHYVTNLRALSDHAGNRLCTQAQFHWRQVFAQIIDAIRHAGLNTLGQSSDGDWQYQTIADSVLFRPICYKLNRCPFQASFDRECTIRSRVETFAGLGVPSRKWGPEHAITNPDGIGTVGPIQPAEWLANPGAARKQ